jgi:CO/xanthine dehydrogenase FAD-binding subunit
LSVEEALDVLDRYGGEAKVLAGGQSLMPLINMRLARPEVLVDINQLEELSYVRHMGETLRIGALTRHAAIEADASVARANPLLAYATGLIGYPSIRSRATFGGSISHADPAAEYPTVAVALDAEMQVRSRKRGNRHIPAQAFFKGLLTTDLADDELLTEVLLPSPGTNTGWAYEELATRPGDYATVGVIALLTLDGNGRASAARLTCTSVGPVPVTAFRAAACLVGEQPTPRLFEAAGELAAREVEPESDALSSAAYKREMTRVLTRRALESALARIAPGNAVENL